MIDRDSIIIDPTDCLEVYIIGYEWQGESVIISIGDKFLGIIDCFKTGNLFETKRIIEEKNIPIDFLCWTHVDWDHTYGLSELKKYINSETIVSIPGGYQSAIVRDLFNDPLCYQHKEYRDITRMIDDVENLIITNEHTSILNMNFIYNDQKIRFSINAFSPIGKKIRNIDLKQLKESHEKNQSNVGKEWYDGTKSLNNIFSVGLNFTLELKNETIKICLTGDLDNETIYEMDERKRNSIFLNNTLLKIPHHGSDGSNALLNKSIINEINWKYAVSTSFHNKLPRKEVLDKYSELGDVYRTELKHDKEYGVFVYRKNLIDILNEDSEIELIGDAGKHVYNLE